MSRLGVEVELIVRHGAVSAQVAAAMARGARRAAQSDWAISVTGIAGPGGGSPEKPVGLVYFGLADPEGKIECARHQFLGDREDIRRQAVQAALDLLRRGLTGAPLEGVVSFEAN
jgi:PncC family amidohydrolase